MSAQQNITIGFVGVGGIATALVKGFCRASSFRGNILLSPRNREKSLALQESCPERVGIARSNQDVIDRSDVVFMCVLPTVLREIAGGLNFHRENHVVHLAAGINLEESASWYKPAEQVTHIVPLPFAAFNTGPIVHYGRDELVRGLLESVGELISVPRERDLEILGSMTGTMVSFHALAAETVRWGVGKGVGFQRALEYVTAMNAALSGLMREECGEDIDAFLHENTTPHGTNELALKANRHAGIYSAWGNSLELVGRRYRL